MNKFVVLYGPTAVGKTDFSWELARKINAEIINMDVGQFYEPFSIGTAKPDWKNSDIVHHFFDVLKEPKHFTVVEYALRVKRLFHEIWNRGKIPLLVGGSGFYLHNLLFPVAHEKHEKDEGKKDLVFDPIAPCHVIWLSRDTRELYDRINQRTELMFEEGFVSEVHNLLGTLWEDFMLQKKLIGYNEVILYLKQQKTHNYSVSHHPVPQALKDAMAQRTRQYAKRQRTFWRYIEKKIQAIPHQKECFLHHVDLSKVKKDLLIDSILDRLEHYL